MKRFSIIIMFVLIGVCSSSALRVSLNKRDNIYGLKVYPLYTADDAELVVYRTSNRVEGSSDNLGIWYFTENPEDAKTGITIVNNPQKADLLVYFTDDPSQAGWKKNEEQKRHLLNRR